MDPVSSVAATSDIAGLLPFISNFGFAGIVFVIWYFDMRKIDKLQDVIKDQVEDKKNIRILYQDYKSEMKSQSSIMMEMIRSLSKREEESNQLRKSTNQVLERIAAKL